MRKRWVPAFGSFTALVLGFSVADLTNVRWLGGIVLVVIGVISAFIMFELAGWLRVFVMALVVATAFTISHPLGAVLGSYGSLVLVSLAAGFIIYLFTPGAVHEVTYL